MTGIKIGFCQIASNKTGSSSNSNFHKQVHPLFWLDVYRTKWPLRYKPSGPLYGRGGYYLIPVYLPAPNGKRSRTSPDRTTTRVALSGSPGFGTLLWTIGSVSGML